jgi:hypothetical protein
MLRAAGFLLLGALFGVFFRLPAFMLLVLLTLVVYGFTQWRNPIWDVGWDLLVALLALQSGYALTIISRLLLRTGDRRTSHNSCVGSEHDGRGSGNDAP